MKSRTQLILFALTAMLLFASTIQQQTGLFKFKKLGGVTYSKPKPEATWRNFIDGDLQAKSEAYLQQNFGFHEPLTRLYNQTQWTFFRYSKVAEDQRILITSDNWIFEPWTVEEYYQSRAYRYAQDSAEMASFLETEAQLLYKVQKIIEPYGTHLFVALLPGKELICAEHMPENTQYFKEKKITAFDFYSKRLDEIGINNINLGKWFMQMKDTVSYPLYPQTGTHWSNLAAIHSFDTILRYMEWLSDSNMLNIKAGGIYKRTLMPDNDLESLMNLIWPLNKAPNYLAAAYYDIDTTAWHPHLLTIGDSYYWNILNHTPIWDVFDSIPYWYYFSTAYFNGPESSVGKIDILKEVLSADFVMLANSTVAQYDLNKGFAQRFLTEWCYDDEEIAEVKTEMKERIRKNESWMEGIVKKAENQGLPVDSVLNMETSYFIKNRPEECFPALKDSIPNKQSNRAKQIINQLKSTNHGIQ